MNELVSLLRASRVSARSGPTAAAKHQMLAGYVRRVWGDIEVEAALRETGPRSWTLEECMASALRFQTRTSWATGDSKAQQAAKRNGWLNECCAHMRAPPPMAPNWTFERCRDSALQYQRRVDWQRGARQAYKAALRNDWLDQCCGHMGARPSRRQRHRQTYTVEECMASALQFKKRSGWKRGDRLTYDDALRNGWLDQCCGHMDEPPRRWTSERCLASALQYQTRTSWAAGNPRASEAAKQLGCYEACCAHMKAKPKTRNWTIEACMASAAQYATRLDWQRGDGSAYSAAQRHRWLDACCPHMKASARWTIEACMASAAQYGTRSEWYSGSVGAYSAAVKKGWLNQCCAHMGTPRNQAKIHRPAPTPSVSGVRAS